MAAALYVATSLASPLLEACNGDCRPVAAASAAFWLTLKAQRTPHRAKEIRLILSKLNPYTDNLVLRARVLERTLNGAREADDVE